MADNEIKQKDLFRIVSAELVKAASQITGFSLKKPQFGSAANISGIRNDTQMFSQRHDSRTIFASHSDYGYRAKAGAWIGADKTAIAACRDALRAAKVPSKEIAGIEVIAEMGQVAEGLSKKDFKIYEPTMLRKLARARRVIDGIPVWCSYSTVGLNLKAQLGWLEIHWPEIPPVVVQEAKVLEALVKRDFKVPDLAGARVETVEAGFIHSPAVGFYMDIIATIRVIYSGLDPEVGRKPVLYLERHGNSVPLPRDIDSAKLLTNEGSRPQPR